MRTVNAWCGAGLVALGVALAGAGCGGSSPEAHGGSAGSVGSAGRAASAGSAGASGGVSAAGAGGSSSGGVSGSSSNAGAGGGLVLGDSKTEACIAYAFAGCARQVLCRDPNGDTSGCIGASEGCPDVVFSDGATRTVAGLKACAEAYSTFPCDKLAAGELPDCVSPGTRTQGMPCAFPSQCASLDCKSGKESSCGECAKQGALGDDCTAPDASCGDNLRCDSTNKCVLIAPPIAPPSNPGDPCQVSSDCNGLGCSLSTHVCTKLPAPGMSCADVPSCAEGYCDSATQICVTLPAKGEPCGVNPYSGRAESCAPNLLCAQTSHSMGTCQPLPVAGEACFLDADTGKPFSDYQCLNNGHCDLGTPPKCVPQGGQGAACTAGMADCLPGLDCECPDGTASCDSTTTICVELRLAGQACGAPGLVCHPGFACTSGVCKPIDSRGSFAAACLAK